MPIKQRETTKLFYNKYAYKIIVRSDLSSIFGSHRQNYRKEILDNMELDISQGRTPTLKKWRSTVEISIGEFQKAKIIDKLLQEYKDHRIRAEHHYSLTIYTNTVELVDDLEKQLKYGIREIYRPKEGVLEFLNTNVETAIIKTEMPYEYRVYLNGNKVDSSFANWLKSNTDKSRIGPIAIMNIEKGHYTGGNYFYIKNEKVLTMIRMLVGHNIRKVERLVYLADIDK